MKKTKASTIVIKDKALVVNKKSIWKKYYLEIWLCNASDLIFS